MSTLIRPSFAALLALSLAVFAAPAAFAQQSSARSVDSPRYDVDVQVQDGGSLVVQETQQIAFHGGPFRKGTRQISARETDGVRDVSVREGDRQYVAGRENPYTFSVSRGNGQVLVEWWFPETTNQTRTFVVTYRVDGAVRYYQGGDQLRWNALAQDRGYTVAQSAVTVHLPRDVPAGGWKLDAYPGQYLRGTPAGSGTLASWQGANVPPNQGFEVRAQWPHGLVTGNPPAWQAASDAAAQRRENLAPVLTLAFGAASLVVAIGGGLWLLLGWFGRGRDVPIGAVPREIDEAPSDLPPGVAGTLVDEGADVQDVIATVLDLARRRVIQIDEVRDDALAGSQRDFEITLLETDAERMRPFERRVLDTFFAEGSPVRLSRLGDWFHRAIPAIQSALYDEVANEGLFEQNPERIRQRYRRLGMATGIGGLILAFVLGGAFGDLTGTAAWPGIVLALVGGGVWLVARRMPKRTAAGALEAARWRAYARHLEHAQPDAIDRVNQLRERASRTKHEQRAEVFEETLPYAVAFGIERSWVQKFASVGVPAPGWLGTPGGPVIVMGGPGWGGPWMGGPWGSGAGHRGGGAAPNGSAGPQGWNDSAQGGVEQASGSLMDLLNRASEVLGHGGGSDWSGGGAGGGWSGGGGGGSGGGGSSFS